MNIFEVMIKSIKHFLIIFFIFQQLKSQIDQNGVNPFCDETLHINTDISHNVRVTSSRKGAVVYWIEHFVSASKGRAFDSRHCLELLSFSNRPLR